METGYEAGRKTSAAMDIFTAVQSYITKIVAQGDVTSQGAAKMKILLLDRDTVGGHATILESMALMFYRSP